MSELVPRQQAAIAQAFAAPDIFGRPKVSKATIRRLRVELEEAAVSQFKVERAKQTAVAGMLAENQVRSLADALYGDDPAKRMMADDYIRALHAVGVNQIIKAGS